MLTYPASSDRDARLWLLLLIGSFAYFFSVNQADNDLWGHLFAGREILALGSLPRVDVYSYTVSGLPWLNHEWLSHVIFAELYRLAGSAGLLLYKVAAAFVAFGLTFASIRRRSSNPWIWGGVGLLTIATLARGFAIRPQVFTYAALAFVLYCLDRYPRRPGLLWVLPPLFVLWANVHGGFVLGLVIVAGFAFYNAAIALILPRSATTPREPANLLLTPMVVLVLSLGAGLLTPYGPTLLRYLWDELSRSHPITEWQPALPWQSEHVPFYLMLILFVATIVASWLTRRRQGLASWLDAWRQDGWRVALSFAVGVMAIRHQRHIPVFALCAAVPLTMGAVSMADWLRDRPQATLSESALGLVRSALVALFCFQLAVTGLRFWRDGLQITFEPNEYPVAAVSALRAASAHGNLAVPLDWGAYVLWHLAPQIKPSIDGRFATLFPEAVVEDNFAFYRGDQNWRHLIDNYPTQAVLAPTGWPLPIANAPGWRKIYEDAVSTLYVQEDHAGDFRLGSPQTGSSGVFP